MKRAAVALVGVAAALALVGCSTLNEGTVTQKEHTAAYTYTSIICMPSGKTTVCIPQVYSEPEHWILDIKKGKETGQLYVTEQSWDSIHVGEYVKEGK